MRLPTALLRSGYESLAAKTGVQAPLTATDERSGSTLDDKGIKVNLPPYHDSPIVADVCQWVSGVANGPIRLLVKSRGSWVVIEDHPFLDFINDPSPRYTVINYQAHGFESLLRYGNAYSRIVYPDSGMPEPIGLIPWAPLETRHRASWRDEDEMVIGYNHRGRYYEPEEVLHVRYGLDNENMLLGVSPFKYVRRNLESDMLAVELLMSLMRSNIYTQFVYSPDGKMGEDYEPEMAKDLLAAFLQENYSGERAGGVMSVGVGVKVQEVGRSPNELRLGDVSKQAEERGTAAARVPASVVGLGAGLQTGTRNQVNTQRQFAFENCIEPLQRLKAGTYWKFVLPMFLPDPRMKKEFLVEFDNSRHRFLREDRLEEARRLAVLVAQEIYTPAMARAKLEQSELD